MHRRQPRRSRPRCGRGSRHPPPTTPRRRRDDDASTTADEIAAYVAGFSDELLVDLDTATAHERAAFHRYLSNERAERVAGELRSGKRPRVLHDSPNGSHSIAVIDSDGTIVAGTHSISWTAWGAGLFVGGMALNVAGYQIFNWQPAPGARLSQCYASMLIHGPHGWYGTASNSAGTLPVQLQAAIDHLGRGVPLTELTQQPRWGEPAGRPSFPLETSFPPRHIDELAKLDIPAERADGVGAGHLCAAGIYDGQRVAVGNPRWRGAAMAN